MGRDLEKAGKASGYKADQTAVGRDTRKVR